jgi:hypothetical protein
MAAWRTGPAGRPCQLRFAWQLRRQLAAVGQGQVLLLPVAGDHGPGQDHRLGHQGARRRRFGDLQLGPLVVAADPALGLVQIEGPPGQPPAAPPLHQGMDLTEIPLLGRGQLDQLVGIAVTEAIGGSHPAGFQPKIRHRAVLGQLHPQAQGGAALAHAQAHRAGAEHLGEHRQGAPGQVEAAGPAPGFDVEGAVRRHQPAGVGDVNPQPRCAIGPLLQGEAVVDVAGVRIVDGDGVQAGEVAAAIVTGKLRGGQRHQPQGLRLQLRGEARLPGGVFQGGQMVPLPLAQVHQQVPDRRGFHRAMGRLQGPVQVVGQGTAGVAAGPLPQQGQVLALLGIELLRIDRAALAQGLLPLATPLLGQLLAAGVPPQPAHIHQRPGLHLLLAPAEQGLGALQPQPAGGPLDRVAAVADQVDEVPQVEGRRVVQQQQPGRPQLPGAGGGLLQRLRAQTPGGLGQPGGWGLIAGQGGQQIELPDPPLEGLGVEAHPEIEARALLGHDHRQQAAAVVVEADQVTRREPTRGGGQLSLRDSRRAAGPRSGPA